MMPDNPEMQSLLADIQRQQMATLESTLNQAIEKGFIKIRGSTPMLFKQVDADRIEFRQSIVLDYLGAERLEELEKEIDDLKKSIDYLSKINADLHNALQDFYEKTKVNKWLKNQPPSQ